MAAAARRQGRGRPSSRVRPRRDPRHRGSPLFEGVWRKGERYPVWMSHGDRVTELPAGFRVVGTSAERADRDDRRRGAPLLRHAVSSRGRAHAAGRSAHPQLRAQDRRLQRRLDDARLQGRGDREDPRAGRQRARDLRAVGRRRFVGRRRADPRGDRRSAHLRVRRSRPDAARTRASRSSICSATTTTFRSSTSTRPTSSSARSPASAIRRPSARSSANCSSTCSRPRRRRSAAPISSPRARSIPT